MYKFTTIKLVIVASTLSVAFSCQAETQITDHTRSQQMMSNVLLQQEMHNIKHTTQCESYLYQANSPLVVATSSYQIGFNCPVAQQFIQQDLDFELVPLSSTTKSGVMLRFAVSGNRYILALKGEVDHCSQQIQASATSLAALL